jgi:hypothetical protein
MSCAFISAALQTPDTVPLQTYSSSEYGILGSRMLIHSALLTHRLSSTLLVTNLRPDEQTLGFKDAFVQASDTAASRDWENATPIDVSG